MNTLYYPIVFLLCHFVGDFLLQTDWMAMNKGKKTLNCLVHVLIYTACFTVLTLSWKALLFIAVTHFTFDRFPIIIKKLIYWKNHFPTGKYPSFSHCSTTGYYDDSPYNKPETDLTLSERKAFGEPRHFFITVWLYIVTDNVLHLICNLIALTLMAT